MAKNKLISDFQESFHKALAPLYEKLDKIPYDKLYGYPNYYRWGAFSAIVLLFSALYFFLFFSPLNDEITDLERTREMNKNKIFREVSRLKKLPTIENQLALIREKLTYAQNEFPTEKEIPIILDKISKIAQKNNLLLASINKHIACG